MMLADIRNIRNHYVLRSANIFDQVLRSTGTPAKKSAQKESHKWLGIWEPEEAAAKLSNWKKLQCKEKGITAGGRNW